MPDGIVSQRDFVQMMGQQDMHLSITTGNTVVFDSFSAEPEVRRRNIMNNNISKLNETSTHFRTEFSVGVQAKSVSAVLCASTVSAYRVVDKKTGKTLSASDKRPKYIKEYQAQKQAKRPRTAEPMDQPGLNICPAFLQGPLAMRGSVFEQHLEHRQPISLATSESIFDHHPGRPKCDTSIGVGFHQGSITDPSIMNFTSSSSPLSPRTVDHSEEEEAGPIPFPFKSNAPLIEHQPIFGDSGALLSQTALSDNVQAVVSVSDVLESRIYPMSEELQKNARMLLDMRQRCCRN